MLSVSKLLFRNDWEFFQVASYWRATTFSNSLLTRGRRDIGRYWVARDGSPFLNIGLTVVSFKEVGSSLDVRDRWVVWPTVSDLSHSFSRCIPGARLIRQIFCHHPGNALEQLKHCGLLNFLEIVKQTMRGCSCTGLCLLNWSIRVGYNGSEEIAEVLNKWCLRRGACLHSSSQGVYRIPQWTWISWVGTTFFLKVSILQCTAEVGALFPEIPKHFSCCGVGWWF